MDTPPSSANPVPTPVDPAASSILPKKSQTLPWVEKYRPARLSDLVAQDDIVSVLTRLIESNRLPHLLFYGPPGTGKTSTIVAAAKMMYGERYGGMTLELNASDARGIDVVRNEIKEFAGTRQLFSKGTKLLILDEADAMTSDAQFALRRIIEKYSKNARFCLICNYANKIIPALQSRCTKFRFAPLAEVHMRERLMEVIGKEAVDIEEGGVDAILNLSGGDMRRVLNLLQSVHMSSANTTDGGSMMAVSDTTVYLTAGHPLPEDVELIFHHLWNDGFRDAHQRILKMCTTKGYSLTDILTDLVDMVMAMELPDGALAYILEGMSDLEHRLAFGTDEGLQLGGLVGVFCSARSMMVVK